MVIEKQDKKGLAAALSTLKKGGLILCPSDTVYGLLTDAKNEKAVEKLFAFKNRPAGKPVSVFLPDIPSVGRYVNMDRKQAQMINQLLPGPFTVILPSKHAVSRKLESEKGTLGIRIPDFGFINKLARAYKSPITATSANISGRPPHYSLSTLLHELPKVKSSLIDLAIDGGKLPHNKPSTVIDLSGSNLKIMRHGDVVLANEKVYRTSTPSETEKTAAHLVRKQVNIHNKCLVFILEGDMGVGKTIFVKGAARLFGIENIISPTFVVSYEYDVDNFGMKKFLHADLFNIEETDEFRHLGFEEYLRPGNIIFIEWGEKAGELGGLLREKAVVMRITMKYVNPTEREIIVQEGEKS